MSNKIPLAGLGLETPALSMEVLMKILEWLVGFEGKNLKWTFGAIACFGLAFIFAFWGLIIVALIKYVRS